MRVPVAQRDAPGYVCKQDFNETNETTSVCWSEPLTTNH